MDIILQPHHQYTATYIDDVIVHSTNWQDHLHHFREVLSELCRAGLTANPHKHHLGLTEAQYLATALAEAS